MPGTVSPYHKHNSFVEFLQHTSPQDVMGRIGRVPAQLAHAELSERVTAIVQQACQELLEPSDPTAGHPPFTLLPFVVTEISRLTDAELPRYLYYRYRYDTFPERKILDEFPPCLQVEPASTCNYRCVFCYQTDRTFTDRRTGSMGVMSLELFKEVIDQAEGRCEAVTLASRGEPLLAPRLKEMLVYTTGKFLAVKLNTNASLLDEAMCHAILDAGVNTVVFSVDAATEPAYSQLRVGGQLERVVRNIERFQDIRTHHDHGARTITRVSGVRVNGASGMDDMEAFWGHLVDQVAFVQYNPWENTYERPVNGITTPCSDLWRRLFVWWDGTVNPCDVDYRSTLAVGNVREQSLSRLWRSEAYERLRMQHLNRLRSQCSPCNRCTVI